MNLSSIIVESISMGAELNTEIKVRIIRRNENGKIIAEKHVPIAWIGYISEGKTNCLVIEEKEIEAETWEDK